MDAMNRENKPERLPIKPETIPQEIKTAPQWCLWNWEQRDGKWTKPPYQVNGMPAKSNDPHTWAMFANALNAYGRGKWDGIGFMLTPPYVGIDLDNCRNTETGELNDWAKALLNKFKSYAEISPSGRGVKILLKGTLPGGGHHNDKIGVFQKARYFCLTGHVINGCSEIRSCQKELDDLIKREWPDDFRKQGEPKLSTAAHDFTELTNADLELYEKASNAANGVKFFRLWEGIWEGDYPSQSEADAALCAMLAFWTQDLERIDRLFRASLLYRDKWERQDYREKTIGRALEVRQETYKSPKTSTGGAPTMADLKMFLDIGVEPGQFFTSEEVCRGLGAYTREHKKCVYMELSRLAQAGTIKKDPYKLGRFRRPLQLGAYDLDSVIEVNELADIKLPLDLQSLIKLERNHLVCISGRYDAGKSSFLYHTMQLNYRSHKIVHFSSPEWDQNAIKQRLDALGIERPHPNIFCYPMLEGYEDLIPQESCITLVDYIRTREDPRDIDRQFNRILQNLRGGVAFAASQKHPGIDKPTGGQFAVHAPHHVILLDKLKEEGAYICKLLKVKGERDLEGYFRVFGFEEGRRLVPYMPDWKKGEIKWTNPDDNHDINDNQK